MYVYVRVMCSVDIWFTVSSISLPNLCRIACECVCWMQATLGNPQFLLSSVQQSRMLHEKVKSFTLKACTVCKSINFGMYFLPNAKGTKGAKP